MIDLDLFLEILNIDSTSSRERRLSDYLAEKFSTEKNKLERFPIESLDLCKNDETENLLFSWGNPKVIFCTHLDTVPPYIPPVVQMMTSPNNESAKGEIVVKGRGSCDAKGQIISMFTACEKLEKDGYTDFGLLLLAGEETGSYGAKSFRQSHKGAEYLIVGEPTDNKMVSACKGTKSFEVRIKGKSCHSGYPEKGCSAVEKFIDFMNELRANDFPTDSILGPTTWNVGKLSSSNQQNILSDNLTFRIYFRTSFESDQLVSKYMEAYAEKNTDVSIIAFGGDDPLKYCVFDGFETTTAAFGSDAPQLSNFINKILCGPGSILDAHTSGEYVKVKDLEKAVEQYVRMYHIIIGLV